MYTHSGGVRGQSGHGSSSGTSECADSKRAQPWQGIPTNRSVNRLLVSSRCEGRRSLRKGRSTRPRRRWLRDGRHGWHRFLRAPRSAVQVQKTYCGVAFLCEAPGLAAMLARPFDCIASAHASATSLTATQLAAVCSVIAARASSSVEGHSPRWRICISAPRDASSAGVYSGPNRVSARTVSIRSKY